MKYRISRAVIVLAAGLLTGAMASANGAFAQMDSEPLRGPEVMPNLDNPNNPALPNSHDTSPSQTNQSEHQNEQMRQMPPQQPGATAQERSRCGMLTETLARRRCLEALQQQRN